MYSIRFVSTTAIVYKVSEQILRTEKFVSTIAILYKVSEQILRNQRKIRIYLVQAIHPAA